MRTDECFNNKKVALITGITGMVGSHLADFILANTDWNILGLTRWRSNPANINHLVDEARDGGRLLLVNGDINDYVSLERILSVHKVDYVFHLAAQSFPKTSFDSPSDTLQTNIIGTVNLLECLKQWSSNAIIHVCASSEVFGKVSADKLPIDENCTFHPASPYAISKVGTDLIGRFYAEAFNMTVMTTRMFTHTGPRRSDVFAESTFAKQIALIEKELIPPIVYTGNLESLRTFADVRDAVRAYYMLVTQSPEPGSYYNIGGDFTCTIGDMLKTLISMSSKKDVIKVETQATRLRPIDADLQVPDTTKFQEKTGWEPMISFEQTMQDLLNYWREQIAINPNQYIR